MDYLPLPTEVSLILYVSQNVEVVPPKTSIPFTASKNFFLFTSLASVNDSTAYAAEVYNHALSALPSELFQSKVGVPPHSSRIEKYPSSILTIKNMFYLLWEH